MSSESNLLCIASIEQVLLTTFFTNNLWNDSSGGGSLIGMICFVRDE